ncbi:hypothetical protein [Tessaracoccus sp.]
MRSPSELEAIPPGVLVVWDADETGIHSEVVLPLLRLLAGSARWFRVRAAGESATLGTSPGHLEASLLQNCLAGLHDSRSDITSLDWADIAARARPWSFIPPLNQAVRDTCFSPTVDAR